MLTWEVGVSMQKSGLDNAGNEFLIGTFQKGTQRFNRFAYVYSDKYFENSANRYNASLATMSLCLTISTYPYKTFDNGAVCYENQSKNVNLLLRELGFKDIRVNSDFRKKPTLQTIGVATGHKKIDVFGKAYTLIPIVIRSVGYEAEWGNNMQAGPRGNHNGFNRAANIVKKFVDEYINKMNNVEGSVKFWIVGWSRGGAVAGLVGKLYNDYCDICERKQGFSNYNKNISINKGDIYVYTFASPKGFHITNNRHSRKYFNIRNVINDNDYVTKIPVKCWGFSRPGVDHRLLKGGKEADICRMKRILSKMCFKVFGDVNIDYKADRFRTYGFSLFSEDISTQSQFLDCFLEMIANCFFIGQSEKFKKRFGNNIHGLRMAYFRCEKTISRLIELCVGDEDFSKSMSKMFNKRYSKLNLFFKIIFSKSKFIESVRKICDDIFVDYNRKQSKIDPSRKVSSKEIKSLKDGICDMLIYFNKMANYRYWYIFFKNVSNILSVHEPEICLACLIDEDPKKDIYLNQMRNIIYNF